MKAPFFEGRFLFLLGSLKFKIGTNHFEKFNRLWRNFPQFKKIFYWRPPLTQHYFKQALFELNLQSPKKIPPLSLIVPQKSLLSNVLKKIKNVWKKELGIECPIVFPFKTWQLGFAEWDALIQDPLFLLDAFKRGTDKLKPADNNWEHPGYQSLFEKARRETHLQKRDDLTGRLEEMVLESLSILPLFYGTVEN